MKQYNDLVRLVLDTGTVTNDRTGVGTIRLIDSPVVKFKLSDGFPLVNTKLTYFEGAVEELLWMLSGSTNISGLKKIKKWWEPFASESSGSLGYSYGYQLRHSSGVLDLPEDAISDDQMAFLKVDQFRRLVEDLRYAPSSRRHVITMWSAPHRDHARLPSCHGTVVQFFVTDGVLDCKTYQRSADLFLGVPINWAEYALLLKVVAMLAGLSEGTLYYVFGDLHLYVNHVDQAKELLTREEYPLAGVQLTPFTLEMLDPNNFQVDSSYFKLVNYLYHPSIKAEMAV